MTQEPIVTKAIRDLRFLAAHSTMNQRPQRPKWVSCDGGPHLLLPSALVSLWHPHRDGSDDYQLACSVNEEIGIIPVGSSYGLIINDDVPMSGWVPATDSEGYIIVPEYWEEDRDGFHSRAVGACHDLADTEFSMTGLSIEAAGGGFLLFTACDEGPNWIYSTAEVPLARGTYDIARAIYATDGYKARVYRLRRRS